MKCAHRTDRCALLCCVQRAMPAADRRAARPRLLQLPVRRRRAQSPVSAIPRPDLSESGRRYSHCTHFTRARLLYSTALVDLPECRHYIHYTTVIALIVRQCIVLNDLFVHCSLFAVRELSRGADRLHTPSLSKKLPAASLCSPALRSMFTVHSA